MVMTLAFCTFSSPTLLHGGECRYAPLQIRICLSEPFNVYFAEIKVGLRIAFFILTLSA